MNKTITDKIKDHLSEEDLKLFESAVEKMISDKVNQIVALKEEEIKTKTDELAEKYVTEEVAKRLEEEKAKLVESYDAKLESIETKVVSKLDSFFDHVISEQISDEMLEKVAINEALMPVVNGIKKVYSENFIELNSDATVQIKESESKVKKLETQLSESIAKTIDLEGKLEKAASMLLISEKVEGMVTSEKDRVVKMFKGKKFSEVEEKIDTFIEIIKESKKETRKPIGESKIEKTSSKTLEESIDKSDKVIIEEHAKKTMPKVAVVEETKTETPIELKANNYLY